MNALIVGLGAFAVVAFVASTLAGVAWTVGSRSLETLAPAVESRLLMCLVLLPLLLAAASTAGHREWPAEERAESRGGWTALSGPFTAERAKRDWHGRGEPEHDDRDSGPPESTGGMARAIALMCLALIGLALIGRLLAVLRQILLAARTSARTSASLRDAAELSECGAWVLPSPRPEAFVLGLWRPQLFVSQGLLDLPDDTVKAVLAHERAHLARRDPLRHCVALLACAFHLPGVAKRLQQRAQQTQELLADAVAAQSLGDSLAVAEALLRCARSRQAHDAPHLAFGGGDLEERVQTLLSGRRTLEQPLPLLVCATAVTLALGCLALRCVGAFHHGAESLAH